MNPHCDTCDNRDCFINRFCSPEWKRKIAAAKTSALYKLDQRILFEGASVTGVHFIYSGAVKVYKGSVDANYQIIRLAKSGDILGHRGYGNHLKYPISASTIQDTVVCHVPNEVFFDALKANHELSFELMMFYARELNVAESKMFHYLRMPVRARLADVILGVAETCGFTADAPDMIAVKVPKRDLSNMAVTAYETALRTISDLEEKNLIRYEGKKLRILDHDGLERASRNEDE